MRTRTWTPSCWSRCISPLREVHSVRGDDRVAGRGGVIRAVASRPILSAACPRRGAATTVGSRIGAGRGASKGPFPDALPRTRRAALTATGSPDASFPPRALLAWSSYALDFIAQTHRLHGACEYLSTDRMLIILPPFAMCTAFPYADYYGGSDSPNLHRGRLTPVRGLPRSRHWTLHHDVGGG